MRAPAVCALCGPLVNYQYRRWNEEDTSDAFFKWLDEGAGKNLDLPECSREKLEAERITYLNTEQRRNYLVDVKDGLLVWARNGRRIDSDCALLVSVSPANTAQLLVTAIEMLARVKASSISAGQRMKRCVRCT